MEQTLTQKILYRIKELIEYYKSNGDLMEKICCDVGKEFGHIYGIEDIVINELKKRYDIILADKDGRDIYYGNSI